MQTKDLPANRPGTVLAPEQANAVGGADGGCTTSVVLTGPGFSVSSDYNSFGDALIGTYDGLVAATSHVIEAVAKK